MGTRITRPAFAAVFGPGWTRPPAPRRTAGDLRLAARQVAEHRRRREAEAAAAERRRKALEAAEERRRRLQAVQRRGEQVWTDIEAAIALRDASGYETAVGLLADLQAIALERGDIAAFKRRLRGVRERHARKWSFLKGLTALG